MDFTNQTDLVEHDIITGLQYSYISNKSILQVPEANPASEVLRPSRLSRKKT